MGLDEFKRRGNGIRVVNHFVDADKVRLVPLGDVHLGALTCEVDKFERVVDWLAERPDVLVVLMGD